MLPELHRFDPFAVPTQREQPAVSVAHSARRTEADREGRSSTAPMHNITGHSFQVCTDLQLTGCAKIRTIHASIWEADEVSTIRQSPAQFRNEHRYSGLEFLMLRSAECQGTRSSIESKRPAITARDCGCWVIAVAMNHKEYLPGCSKAGVHVGQICIQLCSLVPVREGTSTAINGIYNQRESNGEEFPHRYSHVHRPAHTSVKHRITEHSASGSPPQNLRHRRW